MRRAFFSCERIIVILVMMMVVLMLIVVLLIVVERDLPLSALCHLELLRPFHSRIRFPSLLAEQLSRGPTLERRECIVPLVHLCDRDALARFGLWRRAEFPRSGGTGVVGRLSGWSGMDLEISRPSATSCEDGSSVFHS